MAASSSEENYKAPLEFITLLKATRRVSRGLKGLRGDASNSQPYEVILKNLNELEASIKARMKALQELERDLVSIASRGLTKKQRILLTWLAERYDGRMNYTTLITRLSEELRIPSSTIRWNLSILREAGLITAGCRENKGIPVELTRKGRLIAEHLIKRGENDSKGHGTSQLEPP